MRLATGETVRKRTVQAVSELTAQEASIARLAAVGRTNSEIGAQLFLSVRTVEWHLRKIYTKARGRLTPRAARGAVGPRANRPAGLAVAARTFSCWLPSAAGGGYLGPFGKTKMIPNVWRVMACTYMATSSARISAVGALGLRVRRLEAGQGPAQLPA